MIRYDRGKVQYSAIERKCRSFLLKNLPLRVVDLPPLCQRRVIKIPPHPCLPAGRLALSSTRHRPPGERGLRCVLVQKFHVVIEPLLTTAKAVVKSAIAMKFER
jgi:hypothetical protein